LPVAKTKVSCAKQDKARRGRAGRQAVDIWLAGKVDSYEHPCVEIKKSTRHPKIAGDFGEVIVLYWLSKHGFECAKVDHTGIDLIANNPHTKEVMGISVKSRTRTAGQECTDVTIAAKDFEKIDAACKAFRCSPYFAIVVDGQDTIRVFITSMSRVKYYFPPKPFSGWKMTASYLARYADDPRVMAFEFAIKQGNWWKSI
jgi:Holliday junction resolvase-like predicted endonuclease